jgi:dTDP-4-dehydrorhamnose 3,5-epimerase
MNITDSPLEGVKIIEPQIFKDERGYFFESYNYNKFLEKELNINFVQDNQSKSSYGVIRGLHFQIAPFSQTKLVRAIQGKILDVAVDIRRNSPTYGQWFGVELSDENFKQLLIPKGFAHGFSVLSETATVFYKCDEFYKPGAERGICFNCEEINVDWKIPEGKEIISSRDAILPVFKDAEMNFIYGEI